MDINELESFNLGDAVKFNSELNPKIWDQNQHMLPEVRKNLLEIAQDFQDFLGLSDLQVKDITVSGSNAAYTYTDHSDVDLHLVVDFPDDFNNEVYRELFDAKKYQYNDQYDFRIGNYDVELYVQDADEPHVSRGIYSIKDDNWVRIPAQRRPSVDDISVRNKYQDVGARIDSAIASGDLKRMDAVAQKVGEMRQAGLESTGEFGPENLAFKVLRNNGTLDRLKQARLQAKSTQLSLSEQNKEKKSTPDIKEVLYPFIDSCIEYLDIKQSPKIILKRDPEWTRRNGTFGKFDPDTHSVTLAVTGRHTLDILRTLAHELTHAKQDELATMPVDAGETGSPYEDEANAMAGRIMRHWVEKHPEFFKDIPVEESIKNKLAAAGAAVCIAGTPGCATTTANAIKDIQTVGRTAQTVRQMGVPGAREELTQRFKDELRRRQGQVVPESTTDQDYVNEAFDQPYKILRWEKGDHGDVDAIARLDDNTFLSIMFTKGFSQETKEEAWSVEFYRNNSQEVTGEGDAQRVFATVISAMQTFIKKYKPNRIIFTASKEVEPGQNAQSRARLYDSLVQRYARAWGFRAFRADTGNKVMYELSRINKSVAEGSQEINWVKPNFDFEWHEVEEQSRMKQVPVDVRQYYQKHFPNKDAWLKAVQNGKAVVVPPNHAYEIRNAPFDKASLQKVLAPTGHEGPIGPAKEKRVNDLFDKGQVEMPIILKTSQGLWLIGGKTRLGTANYVKGLPAKVWLISGEQGVAEGLDEAVGDNYLYHATMPAGMMRILRTGAIKATDRPQPSTKARTQYPTISTTRSKQYAESDEFVDFLNLPTDGNAVILVFDRNAVANHYKMFSTSQGTQTVGDEYEEVIVAPRGSMPIRGTLKGFYFNPNRTAEIQEYQDVPWFQELLTSPYYMGKKLNEATGFIPVDSKLAHDPRYVSGLTVDIKPGETQRQAKKLGWEIDKNGSPPLLMKLQNQLHKIKKDSR